eukprot:5912331-Ditylum_brightwellii.AAC.1
MDEWKQVLKNFKILPPYHWQGATITVQHWTVLLAVLFSPSHMSVQNLAALRNDCNNFSSLFIEQYLLQPSLPLALLQHIHLEFNTDEGHEKSGASHTRKNILKNGQGVYHCLYQSRQKMSQNANQSYITAWLKEDALSLMAFISVDAVLK